MKGVHWKVDKRQLASRLVRDAAADGLEQFGEAMLTSSNERVPIEEGALERSGDTDSDREKLRVSIFYDTPYAAVQHEDTTLRHDEGREAKYLETTLKERGREMAPFIRDRIRRVT